MPKFPFGSAWRFPIQPNSLGRVATTTDPNDNISDDDKVVNQLIQAVKQIASTERYERIFNPDFHGGIYSLLFEPMDDFLDGYAETIFFENIARIEGRITILNTFTARDQKNGRLKFGLSFRVNKMAIQKTVVV